MNNLIEIQDRSNKKGTGFIHKMARLNDVYNWANLHVVGNDAIIFGYYDKCPWSFDQNRIIAHRFDGKDIRIILLDKPKMRCLTIAMPHTWNWQQGAMTQWKMVNNNECIIFNTIRNGVLGSAIIDTENIGEELPEFISWPVHAIHPSKPEALCVNYRRIGKFNKPYGYDADVDNFSPVMPLENDGIWRVDLLSGEASIFISFRKLNDAVTVGKDARQYQYIGDINYSSSGKYFAFIHRYLVNGMFRARIMVAETDGSNLKTLFECEKISHLQWDGDDHLIIYSCNSGRPDGFYRINVVSIHFSIIGEHALDGAGDGYCSLSPDRHFLITDTFPDREGFQKLILFDFNSENAFEIGRFFLPGKTDTINYRSLFPRWSRCGQMVAFESVFSGVRQSYILEIGSLTSSLKGGTK